MANGSAQHALAARLAEAVRSTGNAVLEPHARTADSVVCVRVQEGVQRRAIISPRDGTRISVAMFSWLVDEWTGTSSGTGGGSGGGVRARLLERIMAYQSPSSSSSLVPPKADDAASSSAAAAAATASAAVTAAAAAAGRASHGAVVVARLEHDVLSRVRRFFTTPAQLTQLTKLVDSLLPPGLVAHYTTARCADAL